MLTQLTSALDKRINLSALLEGGFSRRQALQRFRQIMGENPLWNASLFDEHFFSTRVVPILQKSQRKGAGENTQRIASAWADQLNLSAASRKELVVELLPVAEQILSSLR